MIRNDGDYKIYMIQHRYEKKGRWAGTGDVLFANVPAKFRFASIHPLAHRSPFVQFAASGECWQQTGTHGTFDREVAIKMLELVAKYNPEHSFRVVLVRISQKTEHVAAMDFTTSNGE